MEPVDPTRDAARRWARRLVVTAFVLVQSFLVVRAYAAPHREFGYQMFPEASTWRADIVRVTDDGRRVPIEQPWSGYEWNELVRGRGLTTPWVWHPADSGLERQRAFLAAALDWVASNTPDDHETRYIEAVVESSRNLDAPTVETIRSVERDVP